MRSPVRGLTSALILSASAGVLGAATANSFNVLDYGAKGDGVTKDSVAIARAIEACHHAGGGTVLFSKGIYLTGAIHLQSNVTLHLAEKETTLLFSTDPADYPLVFTRWESTECYNYSPLIYARDAENIGITGLGTLDGQGRAWHPWATRAKDAIARLRRMGEDGTPVAERRFGTEQDALRPQMLQFISCRNVRIEGVFITGAPFWTIHPVYCDGVTIRDATIVTRGPNTDGVDPESCKNVLIERTCFSTGDDCIAIKSGRDKDGRVVNRPCENIVVRDCLMMGGHAGIAIGSEMSGGVRNVRVTNCEVRDAKHAVRIKSQRGRGGVVEDVVIENLKCRHLLRPVLEITLNYSRGLPPEPFSERTPVFRNLAFCNIEGDGAAQAILIDGLEESLIHGIAFENVHLRAKAGVEINYADNIQFTNSRFEVSSGEPFSLNQARNVTLDGRRL